MYRKYSKEEVSSAVEVSNSYSDVFEKLGITLNGGSYPWLKGIIKDYCVSVEHFHSKPRKSRTKKEVALTQTDSRMKTRDLRVGMLAAGVEEKCAICSLSSWLNKPIRLDIDHIDNDPFNNTLLNLQFLCPNCHRQKTIDCDKSLNQIKRAKTKQCKCGAFITDQAKFCQSCSASSKTKITWPTREVLLEEVWIHTMRDLSKILGVSDNGIRKHCKNNNIPYPTTESGYWRMKYLGKSEELPRIRVEIEKKWLQN